VTPKHVKPLQFYILHYFMHLRNFAVSRDAARRAGLSATAELLVLKLICFMPDRLLYSSDLRQSQERTLSKIGANIYYLSLPW